MQVSSVRILENDPNKRGDLFGRLMGDLFLSLGYENPRLNIHKSGREIDIEASHRTEQRKVIAECKATQATIGGADINKFVGSLDAEKRKADPLETIGYFVSLAGFKETAIEQEKEFKPSRVVLMDWNQIVQELVNGKIIISLETAIDRAGRCASEQPSDLVLEKCELLAHSMGWIWAIYYSQNKEITNLCLVHADGEVLSQNLYDIIVNADKVVGGEQYTLNKLLPVGHLFIEAQKVEEAKQGYFEYLRHECGDIRLDGLPADGEIGSRRLNLESIFVPLHLIPHQDLSSEKDSSKVVQEESGGYLDTQEEIGEEDTEAEEVELFEDLELDEQNREAVGEVLKKSSRLTILAGPGGGKSTLLKRLAISYAFPERKELVNDQLPDQQWFPLFIRCRQLDFSPTTSILDVLLNIPHRAEIGDLAKEFGVLINQKLQNGQALILVDGLDEIANERLRVAFVHQLRVFLATYPKVNIVITSRKAGFRIIGGALISQCKHYELANFNKDDVRELTISWHKEVVGNNQDVITEANKLAISISNSYRLMNLAKNPLLLTTLLLVKRWVGQLPTKRSILYGKAIEVLLMTWNVEGHEPLDQEEVIPQLSYVAYTMMLDGVQSISLKRLRELLIASRRQMPEILGFTKMSIQELIERVESRSSLLVLSGHEIEDGTLYPVYEFQHLTFQEYLASKAIVHGFYAGQKNEDTLLSILQPHLSEGEWKEVIALSSVLSGRNVQPVVKELLRLIHTSYEENNEQEVAKLTHLLLQCILDEIQVSPDLLKECLRWICRSYGFVPVSSLEMPDQLMNSKYRDLFVDTAKELYFSSNNQVLNYGSLLAVIEFNNLQTKHEKMNTKWLDDILSLIHSEDSKEISIGLLVTMQWFYRYNTKEISGNSDVKTGDLDILVKRIINLTNSEDHHIQLVSFWALCWYFGEEQSISQYSHSISEKTLSGLFERLVLLWKKTESNDIEHVLTWLVTKLPITKIPKNETFLQETDLENFILQTYTQNQSDKSDEKKGLFVKNACFVLGFYCNNHYLMKEFVDGNSKGHRLNSISDFENIMNSIETEIKLD